MFRRAQQWKPQRLYAGGHSTGALVPTQWIVRFGRWLAIVALSLVVAAFALGAMASWTESGTLALMVGTISAFSLGFVVFFLRAPAKFRRHALLLYVE